MTLAVAVKLESLIHDYRFILLMTDSRFTFPDGSYKDDGAKLWPLADQVWAAFSGDDVGIGEYTLRYAQRLIKNARPISFSIIAEKLQVAVKRFYRQRCRMNFLVGAVGPMR